MNEIIPFGKYKGQPVEQLLHDPGYTEWLLAQSWFNERHSVIKTLIINNFKEPSETPEHNRLQARFLKDRYSLNVIMSAFPSLSANILKCLMPIEHDALSKECHDLVGNYYYQIDAAKVTTKVLEIHSFEQYRTIKTYFETKRGWDVAVDLDLSIKGDVLCHRSWISYYTKEMREESYRGEWTVINARSTFFIELKPTIGDEYPRILRESKNRMDPNCKNAKYVVFTERYDASGATIEEAKEIFKRSGIVLLTSDEIVPQITDCIEL